MGLGLAEPGFTTACYVEIEDYPRRTLIAGQRAGYLHPAPIWNDLKTFNATPWRGIIDTVLAGYPCQPFSQAGQRKGEDDPRHLWPDIRRIVSQIDPRWCFFENVAGHLSLGLESVVRDLREMGFRVAAGLFSAEETGATHERQRVFIVAYRPCVGTGEPDNAASTKPRQRARQNFSGRGLRNDEQMADPNGGHPGPERQQRGGQQRLHPASRGSGGSDVDDTRHTRRRSIDSEGHNLNRPNTRRQEGDGRAGEPSQAVGNAERRTDELRRRPLTVPDATDQLETGRWQSGNGDEPRAASTELAHSRQPRPQGREFGGSFGEWDRTPSPRPAAERRGPHLHTPGPSDMAAWWDVFQEYPDGAPALSLGDIATFSRHFAALIEAGELGKAEAELRLCRMADGLAARPRALRLYGNGVHPLAAGYAWRTLSAAHGLGRVDLGTTIRSQRETNEFI
ncbi:DNA cytosine methyltransferase [Halovulum sp. GXIMD14793]